MQCLTPLSHLPFALSMQLALNNAGHPLSHNSHGLGFLAGILLALLVLPNIQSKRWRALRKLG